MWGFISGVPLPFWECMAFPTPPRWSRAQPLMFLEGNPPTLGDSGSFCGAVWVSISNLDHHQLGSTHRRAGDRVISENTLGTRKEPFLADARAVRGVVGTFGETTLN